MGAWVRAISLCCLLWAASACCDDPWKAYPEQVSPDRSCSTGNVHGYDVYIWNCLRGQRVVVAQYSAEMSCKSPVRETSACGVTTALEQKLTLTDEMCAGPRSGRAWR